MLEGLITAVRTLTILPVPGKDAERLSAGLPWFPAVGCLLGIILYGGAISASWILQGTWPEGIAALVLIGSVILTRGLHLDGLADWADSFGGGGNRERMLKIMKDSFIGAFGVTALILCMITKWAALVRLVALDNVIWLVAAYTVSRMMMTELAVCLPYAREEGGTAQDFVQDGRHGHRRPALLSALLLTFAFCGPFGPALCGMGWLIGRGFGVWCRQRIGGVTGDLLGACNELTETSVLVICAAFGAGLAEYTGWGWIF